MSYFQIWYNTINGLESGVVMADYEKLYFDYEKEVTRGMGFEIMLIQNFSMRKSLEMKIPRPYKRFDFYTIFAVTEGVLGIEVDFQEYTLKEGTILLISSNRIVRFTDFCNAKGYFLIFDEDYLYEFVSARSGQLLQLFEDAYFSPVFNDTIRINDVLNKQLAIIWDIYTLDERAFDIGILQYAFHTLIEMLIKKLSSVASESKKRGCLFLEYSGLIDTHIEQVKTVEGYAQMMGVTTKTLNLATRRAVDMSAKAYINKKLLHKIKVGLCFASKNVAELSYELGFSEPYNLSKFFKKYTGKTATSFRNQNKILEA